MTQAEYSPYKTGQQRTEPPKPKESSKPKKKQSKASSANLVPAYCFWVVLFLASIGLNVYNVYNRFAPEALERFVASGVYEFLFALPAFGLAAFLFWVGALVASGFIVRIMYRNKLWGNPVWWILLFSSVFCLTVGLSRILASLPFLLALAIVGIIQYLEIIFWNARRKTTVLWIVVALAYLVEIWMQYEMLPFHHDYATAWGLARDMTGMSFNWEGFKPVQALLALVGIFGIEAGERMIKLVRDHA